MRVLLSLLILLPSVLAVSQTPQKGPSLPPKIAESTELKKARSSLAVLRAKLDAKDPYRKLAEKRFSVANTPYTMWNAGAHPLYAEAASVLAEGDLYAGSKSQYDADLAEYEREVKAYSSTPITDENRAAMAQWKARLAAWKERGENREQELRSEQARLTPLFERTTAEMAKLERKWKDELTDFITFSQQVLQIAKLNEDIVAVKKRIERDRTALDRYRRQLPGFHDDVEAMARQAEATRKENAVAAIGLGFSLAIDATTMNKLAKEMVARKQIKDVKDALVRGGIRPEHVKTILSGWEQGPTHIKTLRSERELIENLSQIMDFAGALDTATKRQYWQALAAALSMLVQHPVLKLIKTNVEVYTNLLHTGLELSLAKARVNQFSKLSEDQLKAIDKLSQLMVKHVRKRNALEKQVEDLKIQFGW